MHIQKLAKPKAPLSYHFVIALSAFLFCCCLFPSGCAAPGEPTPPSPPIPTTIIDLQAQQLGDTVVLTFSLPTKSTLREPLNTVPTLEVWRGSLRPDGTPDTHSFRLVDTVPGAILSTYVLEGQASFPDPLQPDELRAEAGQTSLYRVRTRVSERKSSQDSNTVTVVLYPVPQRINDLNATVSEKAIQLTWTPPDATSAGAALPPIQGYDVYRGELDPASLASAEKDLHAGVWKFPLTKLGESPMAQYQDPTFDFGKTYAYVVRSVIQIAGKTVESGDSRPSILTPKDIYPPAAPQDLVAALLPGPTPRTSVVDLSWAINLETDVAGYRVYRSESENARGTLLTPELLPTPSFRDSAVLTGHAYWYFVTAVDRAGNESPASAATLVQIP